MTGRIPVNSTSILWIEHHGPGGRMRVCFRDSGRVYDFCGVPEHVFAAFQAAASKGAFFNDRIKGRYDCF